MSRELCFFSFGCGVGDERRYRSLEFEGVGVAPSADVKRAEMTAADLWREISEAVFARMESVSARFREVGLSPGHVRTLLVVDPDDPKPMKWLADRHVIDPSTVTWTVDRLEELKLVQRLPMEGDRRVKVVALTRRGKRIKADLERALFAPPLGMTKLPVEVLRMVFESLV
jgi:DNA-binding MarR family transcriptional regulator